VYRYGLPRGTLGSAARNVSVSSASTDLFELSSHGFEDDDVVTVRALEGGSLPAPLSSGVAYYVIRVTDDTFKLSATEGGAAIDLTTDGEGLMLGGALPIDEVLEYYSRFVDPFIPAHATPFDAPYPITVVATVAELAAAKLLYLSGQRSVAVGELEVAAKAKLERWATGIPLRDTNATAESNLAIVSTVTTTDDDPRGWGSGSLP
jgi:hypothetical protein